MIVDCHTHISAAGDNVQLANYIVSSEAVDACIVLATTGNSSRQTNEKLAAYVGKYEEKMAGFAIVEPTRDKVDVKSIASITEKLGLKGVVLYCSTCGFHPAHSRAMRFYESAQELGLPVFFHNEYVPKRQAILEYTQPMLLDEVARTFPYLKIIIGTMGTPFVEQTLLMLVKHENVYADLTIKPGSIWEVYNTVTAAYERGVMNKLLFGSGFPLSTAGECMETLLGFNRHLAGTNLPIVPRSIIRDVIERDTPGLLGIKIKVQERNLWHEPDGEVNSA
jgi:hypothetical protein